MNDHSITSDLTLSISAVERGTGLSKDTLRVWERRYGFPMPLRDEYGERAYPVDQVEKLRILKRLLDAGHRPGKIIGLDMQALQGLSEEITLNKTQVLSEVLADDIQLYLDMIKDYRIDEFRRALSQAVIRTGLQRFVIDLLAPMTTMVGHAWSSGYFQVFEEHIYTESIKIILRNAISNIPESLNCPKIILTTFPNELHGLGLLMAESIMALEGAKCISLGVQTPIWDIGLAATRYQIDVVALSFSSLSSNAQVIDSLEELRSKLPKTTEIWCGGSSGILQKRPIRGVCIMNSLSDIPDAMQRWRTVRAAF
jgi:DNA-binding transcriptional MerR regulator